MSLMSFFWGGGFLCGDVFDEFGGVFDEFGGGFGTRSWKMSLGLILMSLMSLGVRVLCTC